MECSDCAEEAVYSEKRFDFFYLSVVLRVLLKTCNTVNNTKTELYLFVLVKVHSTVFSCVRIAFCKLGHKLCF